jgi:uncharacterized protein YjbI with pentapeptide repeats
MPNKEHVARLKQGVEAWNAWRNEGRGKRPNLSAADLTRADLSWANLTVAYFTRASLTRASLTEASLDGAKLSSADFTGAILREANLREANLSGAQIGWTSLGNVDLSVVQGLDAVVHAGPSSIGIDILYRSHGNIPASFLRGAGVPEEMITYMKSLVGRRLEFYSCFISYSRVDQSFARRIHDQLQGREIRC